MKRSRSEIIKPKFCPYTADELSQLPLNQKSVDHIIPLALGGSHHFQILSQRKFNSDSGSQIEQKITRHPAFVMGNPPRLQRGHGKQRTIELNGHFVDHTKADLKGRPVKFGYDDRGRFYHIDARSKLRMSTPSSSIIYRHVISQTDIFRFTAKVFLGTFGFFFQDEFLDTDEMKFLRRALLRRDVGIARYKSDMLFAFTSSDLLLKEDRAEESQEIHDSMASITPLNGATIYLRDNIERIDFSVGCLGMHIGSLSCKNFAKRRLTSEYDGLAIVLKRAEKRICDLASLTSFAAKK